MKTALAVLGWFWALPMTLIGFVIAVGGWATLHKRDDGWRFHFIAKPGGLSWRFFDKYGFAAYTCGAVIVYKVEAYTKIQRLVRHELEHYYQSTRWGVFHFLAYYVASVWAWANGKDAYKDNAFEVAARAAETDIT